MSKLRALKGVANTLAAMFVSRNNDAGGYWGIGKLYGAAAALGLNELEINLLVLPVDEQKSEDLRIINRHYANLLTKQLHHANIEETKLKVATIRIRFGVPDEALKRYERFGYGDGVECVVEIQTESGHSCKASARCRAAPHNPDREFKRYEHAALTSGSSRRP